MVGLISNILLQLRLKQRYKYFASSKRSIKEVNSLLIICTNKEWQNENLFIEFAKTLKLAPNQIKLVVLSTKELKMENKTVLESYFFSKQSIGFFGKLPQAFTNLIKKPVDLQLNFFNEQSVFIDFMTASFEAKFRLGFSKSNEQLNDLILAIDPNDHSLFLSESKRYLAALLK